MPEPALPTRRRFLAAVAAAPLAAAGAHAATRFERVNRELSGQLLDFTNNHGDDRRLASAALGRRRDLYVYLPPGYDGTTRFPATIWMHGLRGDEQHFLEIVPLFDRAIAAGTLPPMVIAAPDGRVRGSGPLDPGSFYMAGVHGDYDRWITEDVWGFVRSTFRVRPERGAHVLAGASMGGFGAYHLGFENREEFGVLVGVMPPLNLRYGDCRGNYFAPFDPDCYELRDLGRRREVIGRFFGGALRIRSKQLLNPILGRRYPDPTGTVAANNPIEMLESCDIRPGEFGLFAGYGSDDEFNIAAQVESFAAVAGRRGIDLFCVRVPGGRHDETTALAMFPSLCRWLTGQLAAYPPCPG